MRAVTCHDGRLAVTDVPTPAPGPGQLLLAVTRCGICGSDLHARTNADASADIAAEVGYPHFMRSRDHVVLGHEFTGTVLDYGPDCRRRWPTGRPVVALPALRHGGDVHLIGLSERAPGGYAEYVVVAEDVTMPVPDGLAPDLAALTEPLAVAHHAVRRGQVGRRDVAVVIGCGPIGLAVILMLKAAGVRTVVASDFSPGRRALARRCGADVVVDPGAESPWESYGERGGHIRRAPEYFGLALDTMHALRRVPRVPWWQVIRSAERLGAGPRGPVVFECVGVPGVIEQLVTGAPYLSRIVVVGVCMPPDTFRPAMAVNKELDLRFAFCYDPAEFRAALHLMADGRVDARPLVTGTVGLGGVAAAFEALAGTPEHAKILIDPASPALLPPAGRSDPPVG
ncbi:MAG: zinc-binding dehydrogenase [Actinobacteria bacterium]|nr:zinc-binding dehydrogenase [Actinomycetota bacterium]